ncbi:SpaH/EbpB family LPXTG-anchored major pilin [Salinicoccus sesuvii]|uniref:SpaH/EbpB family LPXTG-anchored major pilin n=1 Tax=Salinicoccus sesuvii TaxID=868281 RepID=A0ABV7N2Q1_9STAP
MSKLYKFTLILFSICLMITLVVPQEITHATTNDTNHSTKLVIHKVTGDSVKKGNFNQLRGKETPGGTPISNITFTPWRVDEADYNTMMADKGGNYDTNEEVSKLPSAKKLGDVTTGTNVEGEGTAIINDLEEGLYWFVEKESAIVEASHAVPFGLALPFTKEDGSGYMDVLHVYPKNTLAPTPTIDETISGGINGKTISADIGQNIVWNIQPTVPRGIEEYHNYTIVSRIHNHLDFDKKSVIVNYNGTTLVKDSDYTLSFSTETRELTVKIQKAGLEKIGATWKDSDDLSSLNITMNTHINDRAAMGHSIENTSKLTFDNGHGIRATTTVGTPPSVHTGGKKFVKMDENLDENGKKVVLSGAKFVILNNDGKYVKQNQENHDVTWVDKQAEATIFTSNEKGAFEVRGLAYSKVDGDNVIPYKLKEIEAPNGYALPTETIATFVVDANSYSDNALEVVNKKITIPDTGGTGTILFTVVGLALMVLALVLIRRRRQA